MTDLDPGDPLASAAVHAIQAGDTDTLTRLLADNPRLAGARLGDGGGYRTLLHVATDWPGHRPNGPATVAVLVRAGADVDARFTGGAHTERPLHWAASNDDVDVLDALLDAGADIEADGGVIGNGTPLADAVAFAQWNAARRLVARGARPNLWQAAGLGMLDTVREQCSAVPPPPAEEITAAFWLACHGGAQPTAAYLLDLGADRDWIGYDQLTPLDAARRSGAHHVVAWLADLGGRSADQVRGQA
ncbi:ankyrin repeat domain-containing protein [Catellatospora sp. NPDC049609]|uniref:ankyrin repeat domain-containing protein n=1 Tax=Catellatospora sp. NPDC049609 TaxID=3155505 RepID=UPI00344A0F4B